MSKPFKKGDRVEMSSFAIEEKLHMPSGVTTGVVMRAQRKRSIHVCVLRDNRKTHMYYHQMFWRKSNKAKPDTADSGLMAELAAAVKSGLLRKITRDGIDYWVKNDSRQN